MKTIEQMLGDSSELKNLFWKSASFHNSIHALAIGSDEVKIIAQLCEIIETQSKELEKLHTEGIVRTIIVNP